MEWQRTSHAVETTSRKHKLRWIWAPDLNLNIAGIVIPRHEIHSREVTPSKGVKGNKLWAGYTLLWVPEWKEMTQENVIIESGDALGPVEAQLSSTGKNGHTEQQIGKALLDALEVPLTAPVEEELEAIIIEIHQTNTPCSGDKGCALYLEGIMNTINADTRVPTLILRASARQLYESQVVPTYPGSGATTSREIIEGWKEYGLEGEMLVVHNKVW